MPYRLDVPHADEAGLMRLLELGALDVDLDGAGRAAAVMPDSVSAEAAAAALGVSGVTVSPADGRDADSVWLLAPHLVRLGPVRIVPAGRVDVVPAPRDLRLIDVPAFGTGSHPTTALCVESIADLIAAVPVAGMLDVGTGSGVLALAALLLGVPSATAVDIDPVAVRAAVENGRRNGVASRLHVVQGGVDAIRGRWPLVVANVLAAPLIDMATTLAGRVDHAGRLVLSGIPAALRADVERAYRRVGMHVAGTRSRAGWIAVELHASW